MLQKQQTQQIILIAQMFNTLKKDRTNFVTSLYKVKKRSSRAQTFSYATYFLNTYILFIHNYYNVMLCL